MNKQISGIFHLIKLLLLEMKFTEKQSCIFTLQIVFDNVESVQFTAYFLFLAQYTYSLFYQSCLETFKKTKLVYGEEQGPAY